MRNATCSVEGCGRTDRIKLGLCNMHYLRWKLKGDVGSPGSARIVGDDLARFYSHVDQNGPLANPPASGRCWIWISPRNKDGYGIAQVKGQSLGAHRWAYLLLVGPIPIGDYEVDHLCRNRPCVNPKHLEVVTGSENARRGNIARAGGVWWQSTTTPLLTSY